MTSAVVAVLISDPEKEIPLGAEKRFEKQFGLTPTEAKIAAALAGGKSVEAAAEHFSIRVATVRTHVRKILLKTNTVRRTYASPIERSVFV
jgi:DNA-binding CsgD family transcriptional regulator